MALKKITLEDWRDSLSCSCCGYEDVWNDDSPWVYCRTVANGECWSCPQCKEENLFDPEPKEYE